MTEGNIRKGFTILQVPNTTAATHIYQSSHTSMPLTKQYQNTSFFCWWSCFGLSFWRKLDQLFAEFPELLRQCVVPRKSASFLHIAVSKVLSGHSLELRVQSYIASGSCSLKKETFVKCVVSDEFEFQDNSICLSALLQRIRTEKNREDLGFQTWGTLFHKM